MYYQIGSAKVAHILIMNVLVQDLIDRLIHNILSTANLVRRDHGLLGFVKIYKS